MVNLFIKLGQEYVDSLATCLNNKDTDVQLAVAQALCQLEAKQYVSVIIPLLSNQKIQKKLQKDLEKLIGKKIILADVDKLAKNTIFTRVKYLVVRCIKTKTGRYAG